MKKYISILLFILVINILFFQCEPEERPISEKTRIVILNPSAWYLKSFVYLVENKIIKIPDLELLAVYHSKANERYKNCKEFIKNNKIQFIKLQMVNGELDKDNIFEKNSYTKSFYDIFKNSDGILFLGGADIPPVVYKQKTNLLTG